jgi:hypothetical protein
MPSIVTQSPLGFGAGIFGMILPPSRNPSVPRKISYGPEVAKAFLYNHYRQRLLIGKRLHANHDNETSGGERL